MKDVDFLLSDEFVQFSKDIAAIHEQKKQKKDEMKKLYEQFQVDIAALEEAAVELATKWEAWKAEHTK